MSQYDTVAKFYDKAIGRTDDSIVYIERRIKDFNPGAKSVLEIGCGTGENVLRLRKYFSVSGLDNSTGMLDIAMRKNPDSCFYRADMRNFSLQKKFDVILCLYDTINHLTLINDWKKVFTSVHRHLKKEGIFIFDVNSLFKLNFLSNISPLIHKFNRDFLVMDVKKISKNVYNWNLKVFENLKASRYDLHETNIKESAFNTGDVKKELTKYFRILKMEDEKFRRISRTTERIYFVCKKAA